MVVGSCYMEKPTDFYCNGFRYFNNYNKTLQDYKKIQGTDNQGWYGSDVISFADISELNSVIQYLTLLRDSVNSQSSKHPNIQKEFGHNRVQTDHSSCPQTYPIDFIEA